MRLGFQVDASPNGTVCGGSEACESGIRAMEESLFRSIGPADMGGVMGCPPVYGFT